MRYVLFDTRHLQQPKVEAAKELVEASGLDLRINSDQTVIQSYLKVNPSERERLELAVSAVDMYETRREIAGELPRAIVNAGTTARDFTVSRHGFGGGYACLACLYPPREQDIERDAVTARELGLDKSEVAQLRRTKEPLTVVQLTRIARARGLADDHFAGYAGEPLDTFYNKEVCANLTVQSPQGDAVAPLAYGSALAGFLLTHATCFPAVGDQRRFRMDFINGLTTPLRTSPAARPACQYCGREVFRQAYADCWAMLSPPRPPDSGAASVICAFGCGGAYRAWWDAVEARLLKREADGGGRCGDRASDVGQVFVGAGEHRERGGLEHMIEGDVKTGDLESVGEDARKVGLGPVELGDTDALESRGDLAVGRQVEVGGVHGEDEAAIDLAGEHAYVAGEERIGELGGLLIVRAGDPCVGVVKHEHGVGVAGAEELDQALESLDDLSGANLLFELIA
jgi:hypothetical protein